MPLWLTESEQTFSTCVGRGDTTRWEIGLNDVGLMSYWTPSASTKGSRDAALRFTRSLRARGRCPASRLPGLLRADSMEALFAARLSADWFFWLRWTTGVQKSLLARRDKPAAGLSVPCRQTTPSARRSLMTLISLIRRRTSLGVVTPYVANCCRSRPANLAQSVTPRVAKLPANCSSRTLRRHSSRQSAPSATASDQLIFRQQTTRRNWRQRIALYLFHYCKTFVSSEDTKRN